MCRCIYYPLTTIPINLAIEIGFSINIKLHGMHSSHIKDDLLHMAKNVSYNNLHGAHANFVDITTHNEENPHKMEQ